MPKSKKVTDYFVRVRPRNPGDFGLAFIGGMTRNVEETRRMCEDIASQIRRHVDDLGRDSVSVDCEIEEVCSYCGARWTEDSTEFNGGCCEKDMEHEPKEQPAASHGR